MAKRSKKDSFRVRQLVRQIIKQVCDEFDVTPQELLQNEPGRDHLLCFMAIYLARELGRLSWSALAEIFQQKSARATLRFYGRFKKYLKFIPGLSEKCQELKEKITRKAGGF